MRNRIFPLLLGASALAFGQFGPQNSAQQNLAHKIDFPHDAPVTLAGDEWGGSAATVRGGAYAIDVRVALSLRNASQRRIREHHADRARAGGYAGRQRFDLRAQPGRCRRAKHFQCAAICTCCGRSAAGASPMVEVSLDGVLFDDLNFYGPDKLHSRRTMMVWELEARRDRQFFKALLEQSGRDGLQKEMLASMARDADRPQFGVQMVRGRATNTAGERDLQFAFLQFPDAPVEPTGGMARIAGNEARATEVGGAQSFPARDPLSGNGLDRARFARPRVSGGFLAVGDAPAAQQFQPASAGRVAALRLRGLPSKA